jgi:uncharacterized caspase-like protein
MRLNRIVAFLAVLAFIALLAPPVVMQSSAQTPERRFAFVIGNTEYRAGQLPTAANDAGLLAETLRGAGFDVTGARDLDQETLRRSIRDFLGKVSAAGPEAVTFVYLAGYGLQFEGDNYFVPIDATISRDEDIPIEAFRISDLTRPLAGLRGTANIVVVDAARQHPFAPAGLPLASGLALVEPDPGMLMAFNATPGSIAPIENGPYGAFGESLAEMIATGGLGLDDVFARVRLRVNERSGGVAVPWYASTISRPFLFTDRIANAPPPPQALAATELQTRAISDFSGDQEAFAAALARDTLRGYEEFLAAYRDSPLAVRVRAIIAVRREAITWRRTLNLNTREAYWSYLRRYPEGAHVADAQRRLARLAAAFDPPLAFVPLAYDVPPPPDEVVYLSQPVVVFDGPGFLPPPPIPVVFLPPPPPAFVVLAPPPPPIGPFFLPTPVLPFAAVGVGVGIGGGLFAAPPAFVVRPPPPPVQQININNTTIINNQTTINRTIVQSAALPASVVSRVNAGALQAPPPAPPPPAPLPQTVSLSGAASLGKPTPPPPPARPLTPTTASVTPGVQLSPPGPPRPLGPAVATPTPGTPGATAPAATPSGPAVATPTPGAPGAATPAAPSLPRPPGPAVATPTPGTPATTPAATAPSLPLPSGPAVATPTPGAPGATTPAPGLPRPSGPAVATPTPGAPGATTPATPPPGLPRPSGPAIATPTPGTPGASTPAATPPNLPRPSGPAVATPTPGAPGATTPATPPPGLPRPSSPAIATPTPGATPPVGIETRRAQL